MQFLESYQNRIDALSSTHKVTNISEFIDKIDFGCKHTLGIFALTHGNEVAGADVMSVILDDLLSGSWTPKVNLVLALGNIRAFIENKRFTETDLNRSFRVENPTSYEEKRALQLSKAFEHCNFAIDIHQTIEPTAKSFVIFNYTKENFEFARAVAPELPTVTFKAAFSKVTTGAGLNSTFNLSGGSGFVIELGEKGHDNKQTRSGYDIVKKACEVISNARISAPRGYDNIYTWSQNIPNSGTIDLEPGLKNFSEVKKGTLLATDRLTGKPITAESSGVTLFPKYGDSAKSSTELIRILKEANENDFS